MLLFPFYLLVFLFLNDENGQDQRKMKLKPSGEFLFAIFRLFKLRYLIFASVILGVNLCFFLTSSSSSHRRLQFGFIFVWQGWQYYKTDQFRISGNEVPMSVLHTVWLLGKSPQVCTANSLSYSGCLGAVCCVQWSMLVTPGKEWNRNKICCPTKK